MKQNKTLEPKKVTICIVNYKTEELTRLCLRSIRKFTRFPYEVIVVDNNSEDGSLDYLRSLKWIKLIERPGAEGKSGSWSHGTALDLGLEACTTEYFMAMHSDTFVHKDGWLTELTAIMENDPEITCTCGGKLDLKPRWKVLLKKYTDVQAWLRGDAKNPKLRFYIRTICSLYRTHILMKENLRFAMNVEDGFTCGKRLYYELLKREYKTKPLPSYKMAEYIHHLAHATMVLNPQDFSVNRKTKRKYGRLLKKIMSTPIFQDVMRDESLDQ